MPPTQRRRARQGRYHLSDPYFRFYFRFIAPQQDELSYRPERMLPAIHEGLPAFVGQTAFEELSRQWVAWQGRDVVRDLVEKKTPRVLKDLPDSGQGWHVYYAFFARPGFTDAARAEAKAHNAWLVDLATLDRDLLV